MTVCAAYSDFTSVPFWIGMVVSTVILAGLLLYLPFKRIKSRKRYWFIPLFTLLLFGAFIFNLFAFASVDGCANLGKEVLIKDYQREITSKEDAVSVFQDYMAAKAGLTNQSPIQEIVDLVKRDVEEQGTSYVWRLYDARYTLLRDGRLYGEWTGD
ncbi:MAG TPA: hypothetical protein VJC16_01785 [Candidatus Nanoarchaeia archaeon]|nr:hypothetical protein [Candidatus Nanoarchaeia archaeon]